MIPPHKCGVFPHRDGEVRVTLQEMRGVRVVDVRAYDPFASVMMPNRAGLTVPVDKLEVLAKILADAVTEARTVGWIGGTE